MSDDEEALASARPTPLPSVLPAPSELSLEERYHLMETLGEGPWGGVKQCQNKFTGVTYALKSIMKLKSSRPFPTLQVALLKYISHSNVVRVIDVFNSESKWDVVQELITGGNVVEHIARKDSHTEKDVAEIAKQLFSALQYLHTNDITHQDLKLNNLLITESDGDGVKTVKLSSAELAFFVGEDLNAEICEYRPSHLAPEVLMGRTYSKAVDLWACGAILYTLLTGSQPFVESGDKQAEFERILHGHYITDTVEWAGLSAGAKELLVGLFEVDIERRWTAKQALGHAWVQGLEVGTTSLESAHRRLKELDQ